MDGQTPGGLTLGWWTGDSYLTLTHFIFTMNVRNNYDFRNELYYTLALSQNSCHIKPTTGWEDAASSGSAKALLNIGQFSEIFQWRSPDNWQ